MNSSNTVGLRILVWLLFIVSNVLSIFFLVKDWFTTGFDLMTFAYLPMNVIYLVGGIYVIRNLDSLPTFRKKLIRALITLFGIDVLYALTFAFIGVTHPDFFNPPMDLEANVLIKGILVGLGFGALILFAMIHLINKASNVQPQRPSKWMTIIGWAVVIALVAGVTWYGLSA